MKFSSRLKFIAGIVGVVAICFSLFLYLDYSMSRVDSLDAQLQSDTCTVGIDYSGIIEKQYVDEGAYIETGDPLFELRSPTLSTAIRNNEVAKSSLLYTVTDDGLVLISAAAPGRVQSIGYREGAFVPANSQIAMINIQHKLYVEATYKLSSPDYARLNKSSKITVTLPDNRAVEATVYDITLATVNKEVLTTVRARFNQDLVNTATFSVGTPLVTTLHFDSNTWFNKLQSSLQALLRPASDS